MLLGGAVLALVAGGLWTAVRGGGFRHATAIALMVLAALLSFTGGSVISRSGTSDALAFLGRGPERGDVATPDSLTGVGVFLFVSVPLFVLGGVIYGVG